MTRLTPDERCVVCGSLLVPPNVAFGVVVPTDADYACIECRRGYKWTGNPPRLTVIEAADGRPDQDDEGERED
jgi:hypothetical protein